MSPNFCIGPMPSSTRIVKYNEIVVSSGYFSGLKINYELTNFVKTAPDFLHAAC